MVRVQRDKIQNGQKEDKKFEEEPGAEVLLYQRGGQIE